MIAGLSKTFLATLPPKVGLNRSQSTRSAFRKARLGWKLLLTYLWGGSVCAACAGDIQWSCFHPDGCTSGTLKALYAQYGYVTVLFHCHPAMLEQVLLTTSPIVCSAVNATVAFIQVALVRITHMYLAPGALRLCVVVWIFHPVFQLPLLQGFFFLLLLVYFSFWASYLFLLY